MGAVSKSNRTSMELKLSYRLPDWKLTTVPELFVSKSNRTSMELKHFSRIEHLNDAFLVSKSNRTSMELKHIKPFLIEDLSLSLKV